MDAGLSAVNKNGSSRAQLRNQLLSNDIGSIDVRNEQPINQQKAPVRGPPLGYQQPQPPLQPQQQHHYYGPPQHGGMYAQQPRVQQPYTPSYAGVPGSNQRRTSMSSQATDAKLSMQSNGLVNLFKLRHAHSKNNDHNDNDEDDTVMGDSDASILTFSDISTLRNNGGHKYGFGGARDDTSPIIPTIMTKEHENMNNIEYRKHLSAQKKMAMAAAAKQGKQPRGPGAFPPGGPRTMSLQNSYNPYQQPGPQMMNGNAMPPYSRANSMMTGPPPRFRQYPPGSIPPGQAGYGSQPMASGPRAMSLTSARKGPVQAFGGPHPQALSYTPGQQPYYANAGPRAMSLQGPRPQMNPNNNTPREAAKNNSSREAILRHAPPFPKAHATPPPSSSSLTSSNSISSDYMSSETPESQLVEEPIKQGASVPENDHPTHKQSPLKNEISKTGKLSVLKLSDPQQKELRDRQMEVQHSETDTNEKEESSHFEKPSNIDTVEDLDLRPSSVLEDGLEPLSLEDSPKISKMTMNSSTQMENLTGGGAKQTKHRSMATLRSSFSLDSPIKKKNNKTGLYKLENETDANDYVTASQFLGPDRDSISNAPNQSETTIMKPNLKDSNTNSDVTLPSPVYEQEEAKSSKGFGKARNFLRRISSRQSKSEKEGPHSRSSSITSTNKRLSSAESLHSTNNGKPETTGVWNQKTEKRKSFHSLFSNSSTSNLQSENHNSSAPLPYIQEASLLEKSPPLIQNSVNELNDYNLSKVPTEDRRSDENVNVPNAIVSANDLESSSPKCNQTSNPVFSEPPNNSDDDFVFDNSLGRPYKPIFASLDELEPAINLQDRKKFKTITISGEQLNVLNERNSLMDELELVSKELAESITRETRLEQQLIDRGGDASRSNKNLSLTDFEIELRKKSAKIVELIQELNDERLKRFIAEEQTLLQENGAKPSSLDLVYKIETLNKEIANKDNEISLLREKLDDSTLNSAF